MPSSRGSSPASPGQVDFIASSFALRSTLGVDVGGCERHMTQPGTDGVDVDAGAKQVTGAAVPQDMRRDLLPLEFRHASGGTLHEPR